ncbi:MAG: uracil-DNA glycosylase [Sulfurovaceae bacterium]|nr:uracil-DNA glycosylase [Sulfurovaceae bacterium]
MKNAIHNIDKSWDIDLGSLDDKYLDFLNKDAEYIPIKTNIFNAFRTMSKDNVRFVLFGQDPYPRKQSASGYAFIDGAVKEIFGSNGTLSKEVNRATSLRNFIKMALVARGDLKIDDTSPKAIEKINKTNLINSIDELRKNFETNGVLLLNTSLVFTDKQSSAIHAKAWRSFMVDLLSSLDSHKVKLILFGNAAKELYKSLPIISSFEAIELEHPYNLSFISNKKALELFEPMDLMRKT